MSIVFSVHEPWHYWNWEPVLRHMDEDDVHVHVAPWRAHLPPDLPTLVQARDRTVRWLQEHGVTPLTGAVGFEPHVLATLGIDDRMVGERYSLQVRMLYAVISKQYTYSALNRVYDCVLVASSFGRDLLAAQGVRAEVVGYPKLDDVFNGRLNRRGARRRLGLDPEATIVLYAPTFGELCTVERYAVALNALSSDIQLLLQLHPVSYLKEGSRFDGLSPRFHRIDCDEAGLAAIVAADAVISDYSGVSFEACAADRPVILLDDPTVEPTEDVERRYRDLGPRVFEPRELAAAVEDSITHSERWAERRAHYRTTFYEHRGNAGARAADALRGLAEEAAAARERDVDLIYAQWRALQTHGAR